jgi:hypothetical protein
MTRREAVDTAWAITSLKSYDLLVRRRGYTLDEFESWTRRTLRAALLGDAPKVRLSHAAGHRQG